jgi:hypothetical protein
MNMFSSLDPDDVVKSILAVVFVGVGLLLTFWLGQISTLSCIRFEDADRCVLRVNWMGLSPLRETRIEDLLGAKVEESCDSDCTYRVVLVTGRQTLPLEAAYSSGKTDKQIMADKINAFAKDRQISTLEVSVGGGLWLSISLIFIAVGVGMAMKPLTHALRSLFTRS